jgi:membrane protein implicated in regulation of membrane protease activity
MRARRALRWTVAGLALLAIVFIAYRVCFDYWMCAYPHPEDVLRAWEQRFWRDFIALSLLSVLDALLVWRLMRSGRLNSEKVRQS